MEVCNREMQHKEKIKVSSLNKSFMVNGLQKQILKDINFEIHEGEFICLLGPSGCGKSTILNLISGLDRDFLGLIHIDGKLVFTKDIGGEPDSSMSYLFQEPRLLPWMTVKKNLFFALQCAKIPKSEWDGLVSDMLEAVHLSGVENQYIHELSGGMQHRVAIARAFIVNPNIILMDEPFSALDELTARSIRETLLNIWKADKKTIVFVTHNAMEATFLSDRIFIFSSNPGEIKEICPIDLQRPRKYDSDELFRANQYVVRRFMEIIGGGNGHE